MGAEPVARRGHHLTREYSVNPLGLIGFDYGYGLDASVPGKGRPGWQFHFQFGRQF